MWLAVILITYFVVTVISGLHEIRTTGHEPLSRGPNSFRYGFATGLVVGGIAIVWPVRYGVRLARWLLRQIEDFACWLLRQIEDVV